MDTNNTLHDAQLHFKDISHLFAQLPPAAVGQFYQGYQHWQQQQHLAQLEIQIATLQQQIAENDAYMQQCQPSSIALAALVQLQASGVEDIDLLERMLERGESWLDHTIQLLERCKQLDVIRGNYTEWCQHALDGAYEWIASMGEGVDILDGAELEDNASSAEVLPDVELEQATEELLLQKLMSDTDTVPTEQQDTDSESTVADEAVPIDTAPEVAASEPQSTSDSIEISAEVLPLTDTVAAADMETSGDNRENEEADTTKSTDVSDSTSLDSMQTAVFADASNQSDIAEMPVNDTSLSDTAKLPIITDKLDQSDLSATDADDTSFSDTAKLPIITDKLDQLDLSATDADDTSLSDTAKLPIITDKLDQLDLSATDTDDTSFSDSIDSSDFTKADADDTIILDTVTPPTPAASVGPSDLIETGSAADMPGENIETVEDRAAYNNEDTSAAALVAQDSPEGTDEVARQTIQAEDTANATVEALDTSIAQEDISEQSENVEQIRVEEFLYEIPAQDATIQFIPWSTADMLAITEQLPAIYPSSHQQELSTEPSPTAMTEVNAASTIAPPATEENINADKTAAPPEIRWEIEATPQVLQPTVKPKKRRGFLWRLLAVILRL